MKHLPYLIQTLEANGLALENMLADVPEELIHWRPEPGKWNLLEIACHMRDEEIEDFGCRMRMTLEQPGIEPPKIDPEGWVQARNYAGQDYQAVMQSFGDARKASVAYLKALRAPQWTNYWQHPRAGALTAGFFLNNWLAHDHLHIRQINTLKYAYLQAISAEDLGYAGKW